MIASCGSAGARIAAAWGAVGSVLTGLAALLAYTGPRFDWPLMVRDMPAATLGLGLAGAGVVYAALPPLIRTSLALSDGVRKRLLWLVLAFGAAMRAILFCSEPALEDDYNRYLWEGALTANGISPYAISPRDAAAMAPDTRVGRLAMEAGPVLERVNHPDLRSNYPPLAQAAFALAYAASPWSLRSWRVVVLAADAATMALLFLHLEAAARPPLWSALYWWNPIVVKELVNSAHMDGIAVMLVLAALLLSTRRRHATGALVLAAAMGVKLWPLVLAPLLLRRVLPDRRLAATLAVSLALAGGLWMVPSWLAGLDAGDGYLAYARGWTTNSALSPVVEACARKLLGFAGRPDLAWLAARGLLAALVGAVAVRQALALRPSASDLLRRSALVALVLVLLSPAQFPWYMIWALAFLPFAPRASLLVLTASVPLYYVSFHLMARGSLEVITGGFVWAIWVPVWLALALELRKAWRSAETRGSSASGSAASGSTRSRSEPTRCAGPRPC